MNEKVKETFHKASVKAWFLLKDNRGSQLLEKKVLAVAIVVAIFGFSGLAYAFFKSYAGSTFNSIETGGQVNNSFGETVNWK